MSNSFKSMLVTSALAGLMAGSLAACAGDTPATPDKPAATEAGDKANADAHKADAHGDEAKAAAAKHECKGKNECKGMGGCKTDANSCKGQNECKGKGGCSTM